MFIFTNQILTTVRFMGNLTSWFYSENLMTYEGEEDVDFEWADNDENINVIDESDMKSIPKGIVKVSLTKYSGSTL